MYPYIYYIYPLLNRMKHNEGSAAVILTLRLCSDFKVHIYTHTVFFPSLWKTRPLAAFPSCFSVRFYHLPAPTSPQTFWLPPPLPPTPKSLILPSLPPVACCHGSWLEGSLCLSRTLPLYPCQEKIGQFRTQNQKKYSSGTTSAGHVLVSDINILKKWHLIIISFNFLKHAH